MGNQSTSLSPIAVDKAIRALRKQEEFWDHLRKIGFYPHKGQRQVLKASVNNKHRDYNLLCSRNFGKSSLLAIDMVLDAGSYPNQKNYIIAPFRSQADEIYHHSNIMERIIPPSWLTKEPFNKTELRWKFANGSFIKLDGADNEEALRGYKPTRLGVDEGQSWAESAWNIMRPNLLAHNATVFKIGTPPDEENWFIKEMFYAEKRALEDKRYYFLRRTIYDNPLIPAAEVEELRRSMLERGEGNIWRREYLAEFVPGGAYAIFPMFSEKEHIRPIEWIKARIARDKDRLEYYTISDPSGSRHATLLFAYDRYHSAAYILDEVVETDANRLSCGQLKPRIEFLEQQHFGRHEVSRFYDEAASLFAVEMGFLDFSYGPTHKRQNEKDNNISLVRDAMVKGKLWVAEQCVNTISDIKKYHTNNKGRIVKERDDCVDCLLYFFAESGYSLTSKPSNIETNDRRFYVPYDELYGKRAGEADFSPHHDNRVDEEWNVDFDILQ